MRQVGFARAAARCAVAIAVALGACAPAHATVLFQYQAICELQCENIGLTIGDPVGGVIGISDAAVANGSVGSPGDIEMFSIDFGSFHFDLASLGSAFIELSPARDAALLFQFITSAPGDAPGYAFAQTNWAAGSSVWNAAFGGEGTLVRVVPEPAPWLLLASALVPALVRRARRRPQRVQGAATSASRP